ncbi:MAG: Lon protease [Verrucomicrobiales bacterium]|nr:Lon protease [Verrucomicrobiales bacterium]
MTAQHNLLDPGEEGGGASPPVIGVTEDGTVRIPGDLPILPMRGNVVFPGTVVPLTVRRPSSIRLLDESLTHNKIIGLLTQREGQNENPEPRDLYPVGVAARVVKLLRQPEGTVLIFVQALQRFRLGRVLLTQPFIRAEIEVVVSHAPPEEDKEVQAGEKNLRESASRLIDLTPDMPDEAKNLLQRIGTLEQLVDFLAGNLSLAVQQKQDLLEELDVVKRMRAVQLVVSSQLEIAELQQRLREDVQSQFSERQRQAYLREQIRAIQRELGEDEEGSDHQVEELRQRLDDAKPPPEVREHAERELKRLGYMAPGSAEFSVIISYLETLVELPWVRTSEDKLDLDEARRVLDRDHYDLEKIKRRLIEYLAVRKLNPHGRGPILCFIGPPGVGKTSLGQSIADALGRKFSRVSLGGIRDEAEIRGHRRTYIGSMPGRIIQELRRAGTRNPVIMLDEVDKLGADFRGDPASALLEVLDPRQNHSFVDRYLDVPFDLSQVIFIATANYVEGIPAPLLDRMETIRLPGYTEREKLEISRRYIVARQLEENGLKPEHCVWEDPALSKIINDYTREAGVRELERQIGSVCRAVAARVARGETSHVTVTPSFVQEVLGPPFYIRETRLKTNNPGVVTGLAYTPFGGEVLYIEAAKFPGKGQVHLTGQIGNVMKESVEAALSLLRTRARELSIRDEAFRDSDLHVHVPAGAVPKDGPSAGIAMFTALASLFTNTPVRSDVAMTGEITLRGLVLPIGGLKEKSLAALRAGIETVIIPKLNEKDLYDMPDEVMRSIHFVPVEDVDRVLTAALEPSEHTESVEAKERFEAELA